MQIETTKAQAPATMPRAEHLARIAGDVWSEHTEMVRLCERLGFQQNMKPGDPPVVRTPLALPFEPPVS